MNIYLKIVLDKNSLMKNIKELTFYPVTPHCTVSCVSVFGKHPEPQLCVAGCPPPVHQQHVKS